GQRFTQIPTFEPSPPLVASAYPEDLGNLAAGLTDEQALRKIGQRTTATGKIVTILMVAGAAGLTWFYMQSSQKFDTRMDPVVEAGKLQGDAMLAALRTALEQTEYDDVKERIIRNLSHFKDEKAVPLYIKELDTPGIVRRAAALAIADVGSPAADGAKAKLMEVL